MLMRGFLGLGASQATHCAASILLLTLHTSQVQPSFGSLNLAQQSVDKTDKVVSRI